MHGPKNKIALVGVYHSVNISFIFYRRYM